MAQQTANQRQYQILCSVFYDGDEGGIGGTFAKLLRKRLTERSREQVSVRIEWDSIGKDKYDNIRFRGEFAVLRPQNSEMGIAFRVQSTYLVRQC